jgi:hypothetical protein
MFLSGCQARIEASPRSLGLLLCKLHAQHRVDCDDACKENNECPFAGENPGLAAQPIDSDASNGRT